MKKNLLIALMLIGANSFAQSDTTTVVFNFNNLNAGNLNLQDGWKTTKFVNMSAEVNVVTSGSFDGTKAINYNSSGPSHGGSASRTIDTIFGGVGFSDYHSKYIISYDMARNYWGLNVGVGADLNLDGKIDKTNTTEQALIYSASTNTATCDQLRRPNTGITNLACANNAWNTIEMTIYDLSVGSGKIDVRKKLLSSGVWTQLVTASPLGIDTNASDKRNPSLWDQLFFHFEGATGYVDNISITRITNSPITSVQETAKNDLTIFQNPVKETLEIDARSFSSHKSDISIFTPDGRLVKHATSLGENKIDIPVNELAGGMYLLVINTGDISMKRKFVKE